MLRCLRSSFACTASLSALLAVPSPVLSQEGALQTPLRHEGQDGMWFRMDRAREVLADVRAYRVLETGLVPKLTLRIELADLRASHLERALEESETAERIASENLDTAITARREAEESRDSIFAGQPAVWSLVGAVGTAIVLVLIQK